MTLLDTPGSADFAGAVDAALAAADLALVVVSAVDGVQAGTHDAVAARRRRRRAADGRRHQGGQGAGRLPARADGPAGGVRRRAGPARAAARRGDGVHGRRRRAQRGGPRLRPRRPPPHRAAAGRARRRGAPAARRGHRGDRRARRRPARALPVGRGADRAELEATLAHEVRRPRPSRCWSRPASPASASTGSRTCCASWARLRRTGPHACRPATTEVEVAADPDGPTLLYAFRTLADPFVGQVTMFRVLSGTVRNGRPAAQHHHPHRGAHPRAVPAARQGAPARRRRPGRGRSAPSPSSPAPRPAPCWPAGPGRARR